MRGTTRDAHAERFTALRPLLFTIAYQDSYLRWAEVDLATVRQIAPTTARLR